MDNIQDIPESKAAKLNAEHTGDRRWLALLDEWDRANPSRQGERTDLKAKEDFVDNIHEVKERPTGTSAAAGLRKLRRYSSSAEVCAEKGVDQIMLRRRNILNFS